MIKTCLICCMVPAVDADLSDEPHALTKNATKSAAKTAPNSAEKRAPALPLKRTAMGESSVCRVVFGLFAVACRFGALAALAAYWYPGDAKCQGRASLRIVCDAC